MNLNRRDEWLETNGLGGFASSTIVGMNTRRYHGLLTAATKPPVGRQVLLSKFEETVVIGDRRYALSTNQYPGAVHPRGFEWMSEFRRDPFPTFVFQVEDVTVEKSVFMVHGENTVVVEYASSGGADVALEIRPLIAFRDYHGTTHRNDGLNAEVKTSKGLASVAPYGDLELFFAHNAKGLEVSGDWYNNFEYELERERGLDFQEDLFQPFVLRFDLARRASVIVSLEPRDVKTVAALRKREVGRRAAIVAAAPRKEPLVEALTAAADQYIVRRGDLHTVVAGYHWFGDWGRDTMIALPGLTLVTGRHDVARGILKAFAASIDQGMLPNRFPDSGETPEYNTVDATLWFFEAIRSFLAYTGDDKFVRRWLYPGLKEIIDWHVKGTRYGIHVAEDGLLACGEPGVQLTWMDAKVGDWVVTPRIGKPVEIQALWYNALRVMEDLSRRFKDSKMTKMVSGMADKARASFLVRFWNHDYGCLYDVIDGPGDDGSLRPNQIFAVSLTHSMLDDARAKQVVSVVESELVTPMGLRTLSQFDPRYRATYEGGVLDRDSAYHQGTVWPWLMGPFLTAYLKVNAGDRKAELLLNGFAQHLNEAGLGHVSEIADASAPHAPRGCMAQAWSVAELLRAAVEDVYAAGNVAKVGSQFRLG